MPRYQLSAPALSGYLQTFDTEEEAMKRAADLCHCCLDDLIMLPSPDGATTYCYATQEAANADTDGAYAVQYREVR